MQYHSVWNRIHAIAIILTKKFHHFPYALFFLAFSNRAECSRPITFNVSDFKRRQSLEETLKPTEIVKRKAGDVPFQSDIEFNGKSIAFKIYEIHSFYVLLSFHFSTESKQDRPEDEMYFNRSSSKSPRSVYQ